MLIRQESPRTSHRSSCGEITRQPALGSTMVSAMATKTKTETRFPGPIRCCSSSS